MRVYVIRHGKAEPGSPTGRDEDRPLRARGERQSDHLGGVLSSIDRPPALVITSPFVRAFDTAERINRALEAEFMTDGRLCVGEPVSGVLDLLRERTGVASLCLVGHNPQLEHLCGVLLAGPAAPPVRVRTGEMYAFDYDAEAGGRAELVTRERLDD